jgi:hypothetical protein
MAWTGLMTWLGSGSRWSSGLSAAFAGYESIRKLISHGYTTHIGAGIAGAVIGILGNLAVARYKLIVGRRISSATLIADARHSCLDALSSAGGLAGLIAVASGQPWGDPVAGLAVTAVICYVGYEVTADVVYRLADGVDPSVITTAESAAGPVCCTPTTAPGGPGGRFGWRSKAGSTPACPPAMPTRSACKSPPRWPGNCHKQAASRGQAARAPIDYDLYGADVGRCPTAAKSASDKPSDNEARQRQTQRDAPRRRNPSDLR